MQPASRTSALREYDYSLDYYPWEDFLADIHLFDSLSEDRWYTPTINYRARLSAYMSHKYSRTRIKLCNVRVLHDVDVPVVRAKLFHCAAIWAYLIAEHADWIGYGDLRSSDGRITESLLREMHRRLDWEEGEPLVDPFMAFDEARKVTGPVW